MRIGKLVVGAGCAAVVLAGIAGCASYANVPGPESTPAVQDPNRRNPAAVIAEALRVVQRRYPIDGTYAVEFPPGTTRETAGVALAGMGSGAVHVDDAAPGTPTYRVGRVWIRSGFAKVDVVRPVVELEPNTAGEYQTRIYTAWLSGGFEPWHVTRIQPWAIGTVRYGDAAWEANPPGRAGREVEPESDGDVEAPREPVPADPEPVERAPARPAQETVTTPGDSPDVRVTRPR